MASDSDDIEYQALDEHERRPLQARQQHRTDTEEEDELDDDISLHEEQGFLVHMSPDVNKSQWNHVDDLDKFFTSVYDYHQRHGFQNMVIAEVMQLIQFVFIVLFVTYLSWCVNYPELFNEVPHNTTQKKTFDDVVFDTGTCIARFNFITWLMLCLCLLVFIGRAIKIIINISNYLRTRNFFISALNIETRDLSNMTWHEVQQRLLEVQKEQQICIHKQELTQLDIYHRILRFKNYIIAMVNKDLLPLKFGLPFIGKHAILTHGMRFNLDVLLYWSPWSIFINSYTMREDYRSHQKRRQLADQLATHITILAVLNLLLSPFIFVYQIIYFFFRYADFVKRSPSFLGTRQWANYGRVYLRHFNELDHELNARLNRAYIPSKMYMNSFVSPLLIVMAKYLAFFAGAPAAVFFVLGIFDFSDVTKVEHLVTVASLCGIVATVCSSLIPDENEVFCPERLMMSILAQIHYMPDHWKGKAHTSQVRDEFAMVFQYKLVYILEELLSPLFTPLWLFFCLRGKSTQVVDFFRCFTVEVAGVGDVCSFAQMDIKKHGNPEWAKAKRTVDPSTKSMQAEHGKTELSLMHFTTTNPEWKPPQESNMFVTGVRHEVQKDLPVLTSIIADPISLPSLGYVNPPVYPMGASMQRSSFHHDMLGSMSPGAGPPPKLRGGISNLDGPLNSGTNMQSSMTTSGSFHTANYAMNMLDEGQRELLSGNMSLSVLHMHETFHRHRHPGVGLYQRQASGGATPHSQQETSFTTNIPRQHTAFSWRQQPQPPHASSALGSPVSSDVLSSTLSTGSVIHQSGAQWPGDTTELSLLSRPVQTQAAAGVGTYPQPPFGPPSRDLRSVPLPDPLSHDLFDDDNNMGPSSLPPLGSVDPAFSLGATTRTAAGGFRPPSDYMPQIKEDMTGEHELDTSATHTSELKK